MFWGANSLRLTAASTRTSATFVASLARWRMGAIGSRAFAERVICTRRRRKQDPSETPLSDHLHVVWIYAARRCGDLPVLPDAPRNPLQNRAAVVASRSSAVYSGGGDLLLSGQPVSDEA